MTESWDEKRLSFIERLARQEDFFPKNSQKAPEFINIFGKYFVLHRTLKIIQSAY